MTILTEETFDNFIANQQKVAITFSATWCGPCKLMTPILERVETNNTGRVGKVDVDESSSIAAKYSIRSIPTTVVFENGLLVDKKVGVLSETDVTALLN